ncbi:MAG: penicillin-binding protein 2, partial [Muribaculaceae bacterium]|nr:penicillin-binding protein 2 [Muribaculaceae bacterium]
AESRGFIPNSEFYSSSFRGANWSANSIISVSIGQGEVLATPLQIANLCATIANRGYFITPHVVKEVKGGHIDSLYYEKRRPEIRKEFYDDVAEGMRMAVLGGTCRSANIPGIEVAGKTGTAQNPHGRDHSAFMGFAPYNDPKIAVCAYVENAGFGATFGVPIGSLIIEKYLNREISPARLYLEERMLNSNTIVSSGVKKH